MANQVC